MIGAASVGPVLACGGVGDLRDLEDRAKRPDGRGFTNLEGGFEGYNRLSVVYVPKGAEGGKVPLMLGMHGGNGVPENMYAKHDLRELCDEQGWIGLFPYMNLPDDAEDRHGDFNYVDHILRKVAREWKADKSRIYAVGFSGGGKKAYMLAAQSSDLVSAIAVSSCRIGFRGFEEMWSPKLNKAKTVSILHIHGKKDSRIPLEGGMDAERGEVGVGMREGLELWADNNGNKLHKGASKPAKCPDRVKAYHWSGKRKVMGLTDPKLKHGWPSWGNDVIADFLKGAPSR